MDVALSVSALAKLLTRRGKRSGTIGPINPHSFRHAHALCYLDAKGGLNHLTKQLGHTDPKITVSVYGDPGDEDRAHKHEQYSPLANLPNREKYFANN